MITVLQRVQHAKVEIDGKTVGATEQGLWSPHGQWPKDGGGW